MKRLTEENQFTRSMLTEARASMDGLRDAVGAIKMEVPLPGCTWDGIRMWHAHSDCLVLLVGCWLANSHALLRMRR